MNLKLVPGPPTPIFVESSNVIYYGKLHLEPETATARLYLFLTFIFVVKCYTSCGERNIQQSVRCGRGGTDAGPLTRGISDA